MIYFIYTKMKQKFLLLASVLLLAWCANQNINNQNQAPNPASLFCEQNGGSLEIVPDSWWQRWKCNFSDGSFCEERAYYHGECSPNRWNWNIVDVNEIQNNQEIDEETKDELNTLIDEIGSQENTGEIVSCPQDIQKCDDWTYVSRWWPDCEFLPCPWYYLDDESIQNTLRQHESTWADLAQSDIDLMNEIIDIMTQN